MAAGDRPVVSSLLYGPDGTEVSVQAGGEVTTVSKGLATEVITGVRDSYLTTTSTSTTVLRSSFWTDPGDEGQRSIKSTATTDVGGQAGIWAVRVTYYSDDGSGPFTEDITLLGTTPVSTVATNIRFIERIEALTVGTNEAADGAIDLVSGNDGTGDSLGRINVGETSTKWAQHWIPSGSTINITSIFGSGRSVGGAGTGSDARILLRKQSLLTLKSAKVEVMSGFRAAQDTSIATFSPTNPVRVEGPSMVSLWVRADTTASTEWFAGFTFYET